MSSQTAKRKGRPNRGGGKFNRGGGGRGGRGGSRGRGGHGRGEYHARGKVKQQRGQSSGSGWCAGKGAEDFPRGATCAEDFDICYTGVSDDDDDDYRSTSSVRYTSKGRGQGGPSREGYNKPSSRKVAMQHLNMTQENQDLVRDTLKALHGGEDFEVLSEEEYDELDWRAEEQYWLTDTKLVVEGTNFNYFEPRDTHGTLEGKQAIKKVDIANTYQIGIAKLKRYGFDEKRCKDALYETDGDIGKALELLLSKCFDIKINLESKHDIDNINYDMSEDDIDEESTSDINDQYDNTLNDDLFQQRSEESLALSSIYGNAFTERIPNEVWIISLELPHLTEIFSVKKEIKRQEKHLRLTRKKDSRQLCAYYKKGNCRFGSKCKYKHEVEYEEVEYKTLEVENDIEKYPFELEVRFPTGNQYPLEPPLIAFSTTSVYVPKDVCLNITARLMQEAWDPCNIGMPILFTLVSVLEDNEIIAKLCEEEQPHAYSLPEPVISRNVMPSLKDKCDKPASGKVDSFEELIAQVGPQSAISTNRNSYAEDDKKAGSQQHKCPYPRSNRNSENRRSDLQEKQKLDSRTRDRFLKKKNTESFKRMMVSRQKLPAWDFKDKVVSTVRGNQVTVISGMTGCGKTTQVPQFLLDDSLQSHKHKVANIICTQPRRLSAMAVAQRVADERVEELGKSVGYQIRLESVKSASTRLLYCTTGILLRRLEGDGMLEDVSHIILDEVHERTEESDFLMMVIRDLLGKRAELKLILMSATLNADLFAEYFRGCPVIEIPGRAFPVEQLFLEDALECTGYVIDERSPFARPVKYANSTYQRTKGSTRPPLEDIDEELYHLSSSTDLIKPKDNVQDQNLSVKQMYARYKDYSKSVVKALTILNHEKINYDLIEAVLEYIVLGDHEYPRGGAILVFLPGMQEITTMYEQLLQSHVFGGRNKQDYKLIPLHSLLSSEIQQAVFSRPKEGVIKIVLATNIAETSITIDDVVFVVDCGRMKEKRYDSSKGMESLEMAWVSRANANQRKGRSGRVAAGVCFHLFTSHRYEHHFKEQPIPEIQRVPLESLILRIKILDLFKGYFVEEVMSKLIESPPEENVSSAIKRLGDLGALDLECHLTPLGYHLAQLPVDVRIGKLMLFGAIFHCLDSALTIAATLSFKSPFVSPFNKKDEADKKKLEFATGNSDHLTMLNAYKSWVSANKNGSYAGYHFCQDNFLSVKTMQMLASMKCQFVELLSDIGFVKEGLSSRDVQRASREGGDGVLEATGPEINNNNNNMRLIAAILVAALYPNVVQVRTPEAKYQQTGRGTVPKNPKPEEFKFVTKMDGYVSVHPSSVNFQVRYYESPYMVYHEKVKTSKVYIRDCTMVSVYPLLLFGGAISIDLVKGNFVMSVDDGWIRFMAASSEIAQLVKELRFELDQLLQVKIENPNMDLNTCPHGSKIIPTIVRLVTTQ